MAQHFAARFWSVVFSDRGDYASMRSDGRFSTLVGLQRFFAAAAKHFHQSRDQSLERLILRGATNPQMQLGIRLHSRLSALNRCYLLGEDSPELRDIPFARSLGRQRGDIRLDDLAQFE